MINCIHSACHLSIIVNKVLTLSCFKMLIICPIFKHITSYIKLDSILNLGSNALLQSHKTFLSYRLLLCNQSSAEDVFLEHAYTQKNSFSVEALLNTTMTFSCWYKELGNHLWQINSLGVWSHHYQCRSKYIK